MARGALRGALSAWLGLIALHAVVSKGGSGRIVEALGDVDRLLQRALDPSVPAIPDLRNGETWGSGTRTGTYGKPNPANRGTPGIDGVPLDAATRAKYGQGI
jgi:hypothetical protein